MEPSWKQGDAAASVRDQFEVALQAVYAKRVKMLRLLLKVREMREVLERQKQAPNQPTAVNPQTMSQSMHLPLPDADQDVARALGLTVEELDNQLGKAIAERVRQADLDVAAVLGIAIEQLHREIEEELTRATKKSTESQEEEWEVQNAHVKRDV